MAHVSEPSQGPLGAISGQLRAGPLLAIGLAFAIATIAFFAVFMVKNAVIPDLHWILGTGQYIVAHGRLPATDIFSWSLADQPVLLYQWLFMALAAAGEQLVGLDGLLVLFIAVAVGLYFVVPLLGAIPREVPALFIVVVAGFGLAIITVTMSLRPMIATSGLLLLQYVVIQRWRKGRLPLGWVLALIAATYVLWANLHNGVALGIGSLVFFAIGDMAERRQVYRFAPADPAIEGAPRPLRNYLFLAAVAMAASLVNPYGFGTYVHLLDFTSTKFLVDVINETKSPDFRFPQFIWFLVLVGGLLTVMTRATRAISASDLLHLAAFTVATFVMQRFVVWAVLLYVLILPRAMYQLWVAVPVGADALRGSSRPIRLAGATAAAAVVLCLGIWTKSDTRVIADRCQDVHPAIAAYLSRQEATDRLYNTALVGSCAIAFESRPRIFFDTRYDFYGEAFSRNAIAVQSLAPTWRDVLDTWKIDTLIVEKSRALAQVLAVDPEFVVLYEDDGAIVARRAR
jgi:hypothetical protein